MIFFFFLKTYIEVFFFKTRYDVLHVLKNDTDIKTSKQGVFKVKRSKIKKYLLNVWESESHCINRANIYM